MDADPGDFLRSRRARIQPEDVGLQAYGRMARARTAARGGGAARGGERRLLHPAGAGARPERLGRGARRDSQGAAAGRDGAHVSAQGGAPQGGRLGSGLLPAGTSRAAPGAGLAGRCTGVHPGAPDGRTGLERAGGRRRRLLPDARRRAQHAAPGVPGTGGAGAVPGLGGGGGGDGRVSAPGRGAAPERPATGHAGGRVVAEERGLPCGCGRITR